jgi:GH43 family beta-xylosidase
MHVENHQPQTTNHKLLKNGFIILFLLLNWCAQAQTFTNPILPSGPDPFSFYKDGYYYYTHTLANRIDIWKTDNIANLKTAERKTIFKPPPGTDHSKDLWAPEIHFIEGKWYVYFAADGGHNKTHRMFVLENANSDPMQGEWTFKGKIADPSDKWAIDGDVFTYRNKWYMAWSGWEGDVNGQQNIYIAKMKNPWTIEGNRVCISRPAFAWEKHGDLNDPDGTRHLDVNEGPQALMHNNKLFIIYSGSACWTDQYALGLLIFTGKGDLLDSANWKKHPEPLFVQSPADSVFAPGHNSFFKSPDGKQDWILYHANAHPGDGCGGKRSPRIQSFTWTKEGLPYFGKPLKTGIATPVPSATGNKK